MKLKQFVWMSGLLAVVICSIASALKLLGLPYSAYFYIAGIIVFLVFIGALIRQVAKSS